MYVLRFNGDFQLEYPNEFLAELEELKKKHNVEFFGKPILQDIGHYVDFQRVEDEPKIEDKSNEEV